MNHIEGNRKIKIAGTGDLHIGSQNGFPKTHELKDAFAEVSLYVDGIVICGDFTEDGLPKQASEAAEFLAPLNVPIIGVLGNHDRRERRESEIKKILSRAGLIILEGQTHILPTNGRKITFVGTEGYWQFGKPKKDTNGSSSSGDERNQGIEQLKIGLQQLKYGTNIVLLHFPPIRRTAIPQEWANSFSNGFSRMEKELDCFKKIITFVMHGHSHGALPEGLTQEGITVFNVSIPVIRKMEDRTKVLSSFFRVEEI